MALIRYRIKIRIGAIPMTLAVFALAFFGVETRKRRLEEITAEELEVAGTIP